MVLEFVIFVVRSNYPKKGDRNSIIGGILEETDKKCGQ